MSFYESTIFLYNSLFINRIINTIKIICEKLGLGIMAFATAGNTCNLPLISFVKNNNVQVTYHSYIFYMNKNIENESAGNEEAEPALSDIRHTSREHFRRLTELLKKHTGFGEASYSESPKPPVKPKPAVRRSPVLKLLSLVPWLLVILFLTSFFWDFPNRAVTLFGTTYSLEGLLRIVSVSGLIGFLTNWLAITMLFRPAKKRPLLGHGLIPAHKERIAYRLAVAVSDDLINPEIIKQKIRDSGAISRYREEATKYLKSVIDAPEFRDDLKIWVVDYVEAMIADPHVRAAIAKKVISEIDEALEGWSLEKVAIKTYTIITGREMQQIIEESLSRLPLTVEKGLTRLDDFLDHLPERMDRESERIENIVTMLLHRLVNQLDVYSLVEENLRRFDEGRLESMIKGATNEQLRYIQYLGALLGTIGGLVIWEPLLSLAALLILFSIIVGADKLWMRLFDRAWGREHGAE